MKNILYFMHVDWGWIKQRPHFLAEELSKYFDVHVFHELQYQAAKQKANKVNKPHLLISSLWHIPFTRFKPIYKLNRFLINRFYLRTAIKQSDVIWFCHPMHYSAFNRNGKVVVYDCMDDVLEFNYPGNIKSYLAQQEENLCRDADYIFASSSYLKDKLEHKYGVQNVTLLNNAISLNIEKILPLPTDIEEVFSQNPHLKKITYIGTVADWFDFRLLLNMLDRNPNVEFVIFGPRDVSIPTHDRIIYKGVVEHKYVASIMQRSDALMMPFVVNELIKSVDPVKAYEYIYAWKPVFMPYYAESVKFSDYVYLYSDDASLAHYLQGLSNGSLPPKGGENASKQFAISNNWENRAKKIVEIINQ